MHYTYTRTRSLRGVSAECLAINAMDNRQSLSEVIKNNVRVHGENLNFEQRDVPVGKFYYNIANVDGVLCLTKTMFVQDEDDALTFVKNVIFTALMKTILDAEQKTAPAFKDIKVYYEDNRATVAVSFYAHGRSGAQKPTLVQTLENYAANKKNILRREKNELSFTHESMAVETLLDCIYSHVSVFGTTGSAVVLNANDPLPQQLVVVAFENTEIIIANDFEQSIVDSKRVSNQDRYHMYDIFESLPSRGSIRSDDVQYALHRGSQAAKRNGAAEARETTVNAIKALGADLLPTLERDRSDELVWKSQLSVLWDISSFAKGANTVLKQMAYEMEMYKREEKQAKRPVLPHRYSESLLHRNGMKIVGEQTPPKEMYIEMRTFVSAIALEKNIMARAVAFRDINDAVDNALPLLRLVRVNNSTSPYLRFDENVAYVTMSSDMTSALGKEIKFDMRQESIDGLSDDVVVKFAQGVQKLHEKAGIVVRNISIDNVIVYENRILIRDMSRCYLHNTDNRLPSYGDEDEQYVDTGGDARKLANGDKLTMYGNVADERQWTELRNRDMYALGITLMCLKNPTYSNFKFANDGVQAMKQKFIDYYKQSPIATIVENLTRRDNRTWPSWTSVTGGARRRGARSRTRARPVGSSLVTCEVCEKLIEPVNTWICSACKGVLYCSTECQAYDWIEGGHRAFCKK